MRFAFFVHSVVSDWNHGNAHFVRGLMDALARGGHEVAGWEPRGGWSLENLLRDEGVEPVVRFAREFPGIGVRSYAPDGPDLEERLAGAVAGADVVVVHEWTDPAVVAALARLRRRTDGFALLFHDSHHRAVSNPAAIARLPLDRFDGVLAFGRALRQVYVERMGVRRAWTFHEAADVLRFRPLEREREHDVVWIGNWGDGERTRELRHFWVASARALPELRFLAHGVRYPPEGLAALAEARIAFGGWIASLDVPEVFARARATLHVPRRIYRRALHGVPTIRVFEALACGIPLVTLPWRDSEGLFREGDFTTVRSRTEMVAALRGLARDPDAAAAQAERGLQTVRARHTCAHRAAELLEIVARLGGAGSGLPSTTSPELACA